MTEPKQTVAPPAADELPVGDLSAATRLVDQIDAAAFDLSFRGYKPDQVNRLLDQLREQVLELGSAYVQSRREADGLRMRLQHEHQRAQMAPPPAEASRVPTVSDEVARLLEEARRHVADQFAGAAARADEIVAAAEAAASEITATAQEQAETSLADARDQARLVAEHAQAQQDRARSLQDDLQATLQAAFQAVSALRDTVGPADGAAAEPDGSPAPALPPSAPPPPDELLPSPAERWTLGPGPAAGGEPS